MPETEDPAPASTAPVRKGVSPVSRHIYGREWIEICNMAREGVSVAKIAKSYKVAPSSIYRGLKKRGVVIGAYTKTSEELEGDKTRQELIERARKTRDEDFRYTDHIQKQAMKVQLDAAKAGRTYSTVEKDLKALKLAMEIIRLGTDNKFRLLGLDKENEHADQALPELPIRVMTQDEVEAIRDRQAMEDGVEESELEEGEFDEDGDVIEGEDEEDPIGIEE
jgi:predicted DNA-binding protein YlxM (UPF0122 family)